MKLVIEIEDVTSLGACAEALVRFYDAIQERHGHKAAMDLFLQASNGYPDRYADHEEYCAIRNYERIKLNVWIAPDDFRLALEFFAMPKPNKEKLAADLARKNETLPKEQRYGPRGTSSPTTMLKQIGRVLKREEYREVAKLSPAERAELLRLAEGYSSMNRWAGYCAKRRTLTTAAEGAAMNRLLTKIGKVTVTRG